MALEDDGNERYRDKGTVSSAEAREWYQKAYDKGFQDALHCFAHWRDGVQYVGMTGMTLKAAIQSRQALHTYDLP
jgi:hypothetical protein